jgi:hypothetical protein
MATSMIGSTAGARGGVGEQSFGGERTKLESCISTSTLGADESEGEKGRRGGVEGRAKGDCMGWSVVEGEDGGTVGGERATEGMTGEGEICRTTEGRTRLGDRINFVFILFSSAVGATFGGESSTEREEDDERWRSLIADEEGLGGRGSRFSSG